MKKWIFFAVWVMAGLLLLSCAPDSEEETKDKPRISAGESFAEFAFTWPQAANPEAAQKAIELRKEADTFIWLDDAERVVGLFKNITELAETAYPDSPTVQAIAANDYGYILNHAGRNDLALPWHEKALAFNELSDKTSLNYQDRKMRILANLGETHIRLNHIDKAKDYYRQSFAITPVFPPAFPAQTTARERPMMLVANWRQDYVRAPQTMFMKTGYVPDPEGHIKAMQGYAGLVKVVPTGRNELIEEAFNIYFDQMLKSHHPRSRYVYSAYGNKAAVSTWFLNGEWVDEYLDKSVNSSFKFGFETIADEVNILGGLINNASTYMRRDQLDKAEKLLDRVDEDLLKWIPLTNDRHVIYNSNRRELYERKGDTKRALFFARRTAELSANIDTQFEAGHQVDKIRLARSQSSAGHLAEALRTFEAVLADLESISRTDNNTYRTAQQAYGDELLAQGRATEALEILSDLIQKTGKIDQGVNRDYAHALVSAASALSYLGRDDSALGYIDRALKIAPKVYDKEGIYQMNLELVQARVLAGNGETERALEVSKNILTSRQHTDSNYLIRHKTQSDQVTYLLSLGETRRALTLVRAISDDAKSQNLNTAQPLYILNAITQNYLTAKLEGAAPELLSAIWPRYQRTAQSELRRIYSEAGAISDNRRTANIFGNTMMLAYLVGDTNKAFEAAQQLLTNKASRASETVLERESVGSSGLRRRLQKRNVVAENLRKLETAYVQSFGGSELDINRAKQARDQGQRSLKKLDDGMTGYLKTANINGLPQPVRIKSVQKSLGKNEAVVFIAQTANEMLIFAITPTDVKVVKGAANPKDLGQLVARIRESITMSQAGNKEFDFEAAQQVYAAVFRPEIQSTLSGVTSVKILSNGSLSTLPFSLLATDASPDSFLVHKYAFSTLSSLGQIGAKSSENKRQGFVGIGAPLLGGSTPPVQSSNTQSAYFLRGASDVKQLRMLPNLVNAELELREMAKILNYDRTHLMLGKDATEKAVRAFDFSGQSIAVFATHGLIAGELTAGSEPALVMTPISDDDPGNDGLLKQSEILGLNMDVDWVILSACNSAAGKSKSAPGLTGIASAFLYAGADSLLVSHWPVRDDAAAFLTVRTVQNAQNGMSKAEALQKAMIDLMNSDVADAAHPSLWAPFVLVGH